MDCFTLQMEATELKRLHSEMMAGVGGGGDRRGQGGDKGTCTGQHHGAGMSQGTARAIPVLGTGKGALRERSESKTQMGPHGSVCREQPETGR